MNDLAEFLAEERLELQRMDEINDLIAADEERREQDPDDIEATERYITSWLRRNQ